MRMRIVFCLLLMVNSLTITVHGQEQQDPTKLNGGSVLAMAGKGCVAMAVDKRFGSGPQMVNVAPRHILTPHPNLMIGFTGLEGDIQSLSQELQVQIRAKKRRTVLSTAKRLISPRVMASLTSHVLYSRRQAPYYVEPVVVGLDHGDKQPYLCCQDLIGAHSTSDEFVCAGVASNSLYGIAEASWKPDMEPEELARVCGTAFLAALERDCLSGYGATVLLMTPDSVVEYELACRND